MHFGPLVEDAIIEGVRSITPKVFEHVEPRLVPKRYR